MLQDVEMSAMPAAFLASAIDLAGAASVQDKRDKLVAINVLLEPDRRMIRTAVAWNARLREQMPEGFALDQTCRAHITLLQLYVAASDRDQIVAAVKALAAAANLSAMKLMATGLYHTPLGLFGVQGITIAPSKEILALQAKVIDAMMRFRRSDGGEAAFVPHPSEMPFVSFLVPYVETFAETQAGDRFNPHVTTGAGPLPWLEAREREPFTPFTFGVDALAVYKVGNFGTASDKLGE
jgi:hypothetical protein